MINTVTGPIKKEEMGVTLAHEHMLWEEQDSWVSYFHKVYDEEKVEHLYVKILPVFEKLYQLGCRTIAEASPPRGGQNLMLMQKLSIRSGIKIIANTGLPFPKEVYEIHKAFDENELAEQWIKDYKNGLDIINGVVIKPGQIKILLGQDRKGRLTSIDRKILNAAIIASEETGMPIHCHSLEATTAEEIINVLENANFNGSKFLWAHAGLEGDFRVINKAFSKGIWLGFDQVRPENYSKSCTILKEALEKGYKDRIILSQDYEFYDEVLRSEKNHPCASLLTDFIKFCKGKGLSEETIIDIITKNPRDFFDIKTNK